MTCGNNHDALGQKYFPYEAALRTKYRGVFFTRKYAAIPRTRVQPSHISILENEKPATATRGAGVFITRIFNGVSPKSRLNLKRLEARAAVPENGTRN
jgi:hypothetical protein